MRSGGEMSTNRRNDMGQVEVLGRSGSKSMLVVSLILGDKHESHEEHGLREVACAFKARSATGPKRVDELMKTLGMPPRNIEKWLWRKFMAFEGSLKIE